MNKKAMLLGLVATLIGGCGPVWPHDENLYGAYLESQSRNPAFEDGPLLRAQVRETLQVAAGVMGTPTSTFDGWRILVVDVIASCGKSGPEPGSSLIGCVDVGDRTIHVRSGAPDIYHSALMHEVGHLALSWGANHEEPFWRDCEMWGGLWEWANSRGRHLAYDGMWMGHGDEGLQFCPELREHEG